MNYQTYKGQITYLLPNLVIEADEHDNHIKSLTILSLGLPILRIVEEYGSLKVLLPNANPPVE